jgi:hypothetical protein
MLKQIQLAGVRDSYGKSESRGDPAGVKAPWAVRPRKASAWSENQRSNYKNHKKL